MLRLTAEVGSSWEAKERTYFNRQTVSPNTNTVNDAKRWYFTGAGIEDGSVSDEEREWYQERSVILGLGLPNNMSLMDYKSAVLTNGNMPA
jgi:hypothetical protein